MPRLQPFVPRLQPQVPRLRPYVYRWEKQQKRLQSEAEETAQRSDGAVTAALILQARHIGWQPGHIGWQPGHGGSQPGVHWAAAADPVALRRSTMQTIGSGEEAAAAAAAAEEAAKQEAEAAAEEVIDEPPPMPNLEGQELTACYLFVAPTREATAARHSFVRRHIATRHLPGWRPHPAGYHPTPDASRREAG